MYPAPSTVGKPFETGFTVSNSIAATSDGKISTRKLCDRSTGSMLKLHAPMIKPQDSDLLSETAVKTADVTDEMVVIAFGESIGSDSSVCEILQKQTGAHRKVCFAAMKRCAMRGYVNTFDPKHGRDYVTDKGFLLVSKSPSSYYFKRIA